MKAKILIWVEGGLVQAVYSDSLDVECTVIDMDNIEAEDEGECIRLVTEANEALADYPHVIG